MAALVFNARLTDQTGSRPADFVQILFGTNSVEEKEERFREICAQEYPDRIIQEPIRITKSRLG